MCYRAREEMHLRRGTWERLREFEETVVLYPDLVFIGTEGT